MAEEPARLMDDGWPEVINVDEVASPALLIHVGHVEENVRRMIEMAGDVGRLRPHLKTHKMAEMIRLQLARGISKFKCATLAEAEMAAAAGAGDILLAYQPVGPNVDRFLDLSAHFASVRFSCVADNAGSIGDLSDAAARASARIEVMLDLDLGQHRTGLAPDQHALDLYHLIASLPALTPGGLHAYDGHIHHSDVTERAAACESAYAPVEALRRKIERAGLAMPRIVAGGTPTFPMHARREGVECSPGTCVFWDAGYAHNLPDLDFLTAAVLLTRVVSQPASNRLCLDLGHKAVAAEMPHPRVIFPDLPEAKPVMHSEEHLVLETPRAAQYPVGSCLYGIPWHVCPTVALHDEVVVVRSGRAEERWKVAARGRTVLI